MTRQIYGEIRIPIKLLGTCLSQKKLKLLWVFASAKLLGNHRIEISKLLCRLKIRPRTGRRLINGLIQLGWVGSDGNFIFPRSWKTLGLKRRRGLYLTRLFQRKKFEALCFTKVLKRETGRAILHFKKGKVMQGFPASFLCNAMGLKYRRFQELKAHAQRYRLISVIRQYNRLGVSNEITQIRKNLKGVAVFVRGKFCVSPAFSKVQFLKNMLDRKCV